METTKEFYGNEVVKELERQKEGRMEFCRKLKTPRTLTIPKDGSPYGDLKGGYAPWERFPPFGGSHK